MARCCGPPDRDTMVTPMMRNAMHTQHCDGNPLPLRRTAFGRRGRVPMMTERARRAPTEPSSTRRLSD